MRKQLVLDHFVGRAAGEAWPFMVWTIIAIMMVESTCYMGQVHVDSVKSSYSHQRFCSVGGYRIILGPHYNRSYSWRMPFFFSKKHHLTYLAIKLLWYSELYKNNSPIRKLVYCEDTDGFFYHNILRYLWFGPVPASWKCKFPLLYLFLSSMNEQQPKTEET